MKGKLYGPFQSIIYQGCHFSLFHFQSEKGRKSRYMLLAGIFYRIRKQQKAELTLGTFNTALISPRSRPIQYMHKKETCSEMVTLVVKLIIMAMTSPVYNTMQWPKCYIIL